jgi:hypothetical protein
LFSPNNQIIYFAHLQVPRWIIKPLSGRTAAHGIENLDDEVFSKRHLKHEVDEKRRKRYYKKTELRVTVS